MATYSELFTLRSDQPLQNRILVACIVASDTIRLEDPATVNHAQRLAWAKQVLIEPERIAQRMLGAVLAQNKSATVAQITSASDATLQTAVNSAVDLLAS